MKTKRLISALALALVCATLLLLASCGFSYEKSNLKKYVSMSRDDYYGITVKIDAMKEVTEEDIDLEIDTFRLEHRTLVAEGDKSRHAQWGDNVNLYYYITTEQESGWYLPPEGFSNMTADEPGPFVVGGGVLPELFESALIDHAATETSFAPTFDENETVSAGDVVYLDLTYRLADGDQTFSGTHEGVRIDLSSPGSAGDTLVSSLVGRHPGEEFDYGMTEGEALVADWDGDGENETLSVSGVVRCISRNETLKRIEGDIDADYFDATIAGRHVVMLCAISSVDEYSVPEITEELLAEHVPDFIPLGGDLMEEFRDYVYQLLVNEVRREWHATIEEKLWEHLDALDCVKKYPRKAIRNELDEQEKQLDALYVYYGQLLEEKYGVNPFESVEEFGYAYYELDGTEYADVHEYLKKNTVPQVVRQKLIVYYIAGKEGWMMTEEEYEEALPQQLSYYAGIDGITTAEVLKKYGEDFFRQAIQYNKVMSNLVSVTNIE